MAILRPVRSLTRSVVTQTTAMISIHLIESFMASAGSAAYKLDRAANNTYAVANRKKGCLVDDPRDGTLGSRRFSKRTTARMMKAASANPMPGPVVPD